MCQFTKYHRTLHFYNTHASLLPITRAEEHKRAQLKVEDGVCLALEARQREEEEEQHARLQAYKEARLVEYARLKAEEEEGE